MWKKRTGAPAPSTWGSTAIKSWNAEPGRQRASDPHRPGHADGQPDAPVLAAGAAGLRAARAGRPAAARARAGRGPDRVSRQRRPGRAAGGELPAPRGPAVLRAQRRRRTALHLPWLEVRHERTLPRDAEPANRPRLPGKAAGHGVSVRGAPRDRVGLHGAACRAARTTGSRLERAAGGPQAHHQAAPRVQLRAGAGRRSRSVARLLSARAARSAGALRLPGDRRDSLGSAARRCGARADRQGAGQESAPHRPQDRLRAVRRCATRCRRPALLAHHRACTEGMGAIMDRSREHLGPSDVTIVQMRRLLLAAAAALREHGTPAPGLGVAPPVMASPVVFLPKSVTWEELSKDYASGKVKMTAPG